jgi:hypothetical protein
MTVDTALQPSLRDLSTRALFVGLPIKNEIEHRYNSSTSWEGAMLSLLIHAAAFIALFSFLYGVAAASEGEVKLGWLQLRGWRAVFGGLAIAGTAVAVFYLVAWCETFLKP